MSSRALTILTVCSLLIPCGCANITRWCNNGFKVGPEYGRPVFPVSESWIDSQNEQIRQEQPDHHNWWTVFNDPVLDQLIHTAYQQNLTLRVAGLRVLEARRQQAITSANLLPQSQTFSASYLRNQVSKTTATATPLIPRAFDDVKTGFDLSWELDVWGRLRRAIEAADASVEALVEDYDDILVTLIGDVAATYIEIRTFDERLALAKQNIQIQQGSLRLTSVRNQEGKVSELDVQEAVSNLADTRALVPSLEQGRRQAVNRMALLFGMRPSELDPVLATRGVLPTLPDHVVVGIPADLLRRRPDVRSAERVVAIQSAEIGIAEADLYPQFLLNGEIAWNSRRLSNLSSSASNSGFITPGFTWKILNYGRLKNAIAIEELQFQQQVLNYENTVLQAHQEVEDAIVEFLQTQKRAEQLEISAMAAEKTVDIVRTQYKEGATDFGRVFVLEGSLVQRQDQLIVAKAQIAIALTRAYKALGGGWQIRYEVPYRGRGSLDGLPTPVATEDSTEPEWNVDTDKDAALPVLPPPELSDDSGRKPVPDE